MTLKELQIGKSAVIKSVGSHGALRQHFLDMGMIPGVEITVVKLAPNWNLYFFFLLFSFFCIFLFQFNQSSLLPS